MYKLTILLLAIINSVQAQHTFWLKQAETNEYDYTEPKRMAQHPDGSLYVIGHMQGTNTFDGVPLTTPGDPASQDIFLARYTPAGVLVWAKQLFHPDPDSDLTSLYINRATDITIDSQGDIILIGVNFVVESFLGSPVANGAFIAKLDKDANLKWINREPYVGGDFDYGRRGSRVVTDKDDNIIWFTDQIDSYSETGGLALIKYSSDGTRLWNKFITHDDDFWHPSLTGISLDPVGNIIVSGNFSDRMYFSGAYLHSDGVPNEFGGDVQFYLAKFSPEGNFIWAIQSNYGDPSIALSHVSDRDGNIYLVGQMGPEMRLGDSPRIFNHNSGASKGFVARLNSEGHVEWLNAVGGAVPYDISIDKKGFLYVTGVFFDYGMNYQSFHATSVSFHQSFVIKINPKGSFQAAQYSRSSLGSYGYQSLADSVGNVYTMGSYRSSTAFGCLTASVNSQTFYLLKHDFEPNPPHNLNISGPLQFCEQVTTITLQTTTVPDVQLYQWYLPDGVTPHSGTTQTTDEFLTVDITPEANQQDIIVSAVHDCLEIFSPPFTINILSTPETPDFVVSPALVCPGTSNVLYAVAKNHNTSEFLWTLSAGVTGTVGPAMETISLDFSATFSGGNIRVKAKGFCGESATKNFSIGIFPKPANPVITGESVLCPGSVIRYKATGDPYTEEFTWTFPPGVTGVVNSSTDSATLYFPFTFAGGDIVATAKGFCNQSTPILFPLTVFPKPGKPAVSGPSILCTNFSEQQWNIDPVVNAVRYRWELPPGVIPNPIYPDDGLTFHARVFPQFVGGTLRVWAVGQCAEGESSDAFLVNNVKVPIGVPQLDGDSILCASDETSVGYEVSGLLNVTHYVWEVSEIFSPRGEITSVANTLQLEPVSTGKGTIKIYGVNACNEKSDSVVLDVRALTLLAEPTVQKSRCENELVTTPGENMEWYKDGILLPGITETKIAVADSGIYVVRVHNYCGVVESLPLQVYPVVSDKLFVPNVITPNGDGKNDSFQIDKSLKNSSLTIFNRWGTQVYYTNDYDNNWQASGVITGTYYFAIHNDCLAQPYRGWLSVVREGE